MIEKIVFMQVEDDMVTFEKENGDTIVYPLSLVPISYNSGDIIKVILHRENFIEFLELDTDEMDYRRASIVNKKLRLKERASKNTQ